MANKLKFYNTLGRKKEVFQALNPPKVKLYGCGPTVYWRQHIGNMRRYVFEDILKRTLLFNGFKVKHVINITDVGHLTSDADQGEDKMIKAIKREGLPLTKESMLKIAQKYSRIFFKDLDKLNILPADKWPRATKHVEDMIDLIKKIEANGFTYKTSVGLIFDTSKVEDYGKLTNLKREELEQGARVEPDPERKSPTDFALWITNQPKHLMQWNSPWGKGFPGWHIECSAMSSKYLGRQFDIHTGGEEHIAIHHTNEIAQSEAGFGKKPWVRYWLHMRWLKLKGGKMSKSKGNVYNLSSLEEKGFSPLAFRYLCLLTHYRKPLEFDFAGLKQAQTAYQNLKERILQLDPGNDQEVNQDYLEKFKKAINDDLNSAKALAVLWNALKDQTNSGKIGFVREADKVLGLDLLEKEDKPPQSIKQLAQKRQELRNKGEFEKADLIRKKIANQGWRVRDVEEGFKLRPKNRFK